MCNHAQYFYVGQHFHNKENPKNTAVEPAAGTFNRYPCGENINREKVNPHIYTPTLSYKLKYALFWDMAHALLTIHPPVRPQPYSDFDRTILLF